MVLLPKALLRVRGDKLIPGEPADDERAQGDDRRPGRRPQRLAAALAGRAAVLRAARRRPTWCARATTPRSSAMAGRCRCACRPPTSCSEEHGLTFDVLDLRSIFPYDWKAISQQRAEDRPGADRQRGHRGDQFRRTPAAARRSTSIFTICWCGRACCWASTCRASA